jgi:hypothetical protein
VLKDFAIEALNQAIYLKLPNVKFSKNNHTRLIKKTVPIRISKQLAVSGNDITANPQAAMPTTHISHGLDRTVCWVRRPHSLPLNHDTAMAAENR